MHKRLVGIDKFYVTEDKYLTCTCEDPGNFVKDK